MTGNRRLGPLRHLDSRLGLDQRPVGFQGRRDAVFDLPFPSKEVQDFPPFQGFPPFHERDVSLGGGLRAASALGGPVPGEPLPSEEGTT